MTDPMHESAILLEPEAAAGARFPLEAMEKSARPRSPKAGGRQRPAAGNASVQSLLRQYAATRDPRLRDELVVLHDRMVRYLAGRFGLGAGTTAEDLVQVGYIGLLSAIDRYDPEKGVSFATSAVPTILGE